MFKKHLTKILSLAIAFSLSLSIPLTTYADTGVTDDADNKGGGGGNMSASTSSLAWSQYNQGYRLYIIDQNFVRISPVYDFVYSTPTQVGDKRFSTRFDGAYTPSTQVPVQMIDKLQEWCDSPDSVPTPTKLVNGTRVGNGTEFKNWFFAGQKGSTINTSGSINNNLVDTDGDGIPDTPADQVGGYTVDISGIPNTTLVQSFDVGVSTFANIIAHQYTTAKTNFSSSKVKYAIGTSVTKAEWDAAVDIADMVKEYANTLYSAHEGDIGAWFDPTHDGIGEFQLTQDMLEEYSNAEAYKDFDDFSSGYTPTVANLAKYIFIIGESNVLAGGLQVLSDTARLNNLSNTNLLFQPIPLAGGTGGGSGMPAYNLINKENTIKVPGYTRPGDALQDGCFLIVEPITWLNVRTNAGSDYMSPSTYEPTRTYGTYWNLASKWVGGGGFYNTIMTKLFNNCLATSSAVTSSTNKTIQGIDSSSQKSVADSLNYMNSGFGLSMHIYDAGDFEEPDPDPTQSTGDWNLTQSQLTRRVSADDGTPKLSTTALNFTLGALDTTHTDCYCGGHCNRTAPAHTASCVKCSVCGSSGTWASDCDGTMSNGSPCTNTGSGWGYGACTNSSHTTSVTKCSKATVNAGNCSHTKTTCSNLTSCTNKRDSEMSLSDKSIKLTVKQTKGVQANGVNNTVAFLSEKYKGKFTNNGLTYTRTSTDASAEDSPEAVSGYKYEFVIHRANKDSVLQYSGKDANGNIKTNNTLTSLGFAMSDNKKSERRTTNGVVDANVSLKFELDSSNSDLRTTTDCDKSGCTHDDTDDCTVASISLTGTTSIQTYAGTQTGGTNDTALTPQRNNLAPFKISTPTNTAYHTSGVSVSTQTFEFIPYIQMTAEDISGNTLKIYVNGKYSRKMTPNAYAEVTWFESKEPNLNVESNQWSLHASATTGSQPWQGSNQVLPGGAVYGLTTKGINGSVNGQNVYITTYQPILIGAGLSQVNKIAGQDLSKLTSSNATAKHNDYVTSAINTLEASHLKQYVEKDASAENAWKSGVNVYEGANISRLDNGATTASTESKYYLSEDTTGTTSSAQDADLDVKKVNTSTCYYTFYTDAEGNVYIADVDQSGTVNNKQKVLNRGQNGSKLNGSESTLENVALAINNRTLVIDKLLKAVENNTGSDTNASWASSDGHWYNEAFNGITIQVDITKLNVGLYDTIERTTVLDPKLIPMAKDDSGEYLAGKEFMFRTAFLTQHKNDSLGSIGDFLGADVPFTDSDMLFWSKKFYIPNVTVQDLSK